MLDCKQAAQVIEIFVERNPQVSWQRSRTKGELVRIARSSTSPDTTTFTSVHIPGTKHKAHYRYNPGQFPLTPWQVSYGVCSPKGGVYKDRSTNNVAHFMKQEHAEHYLLTVIWPLLQAMSK